MRNWSNFWPHLVASLAAAVAAITQALAYNWPFSAFEHLIVWSLTAIAIVFLGIAIKDIKKIDPGFKEVVFKFPRGTTAAGISGTQVTSRKQKKIDGTNVEIRDWMLRELDTAGGATIYTRNLSWAMPTDPVFAAKKNNIKIVSCGSARPTGVDASHLEAFHKLGCEIYFLKTDFRFRFTAFKRGGVRYYAVGLPKGRAHIIRTPTREEDWTYQFIHGFHQASQEAKRSRLYV